MSDTLDFLQSFAQFPFALRRYLRRRPTVAEARRTVRERLAQREANFLKIAEHSIYGWPRSPYRALLSLAGCTFGDLQALVRQAGLEGALRTLREAGVYVSYEEFKGRRPIVRHGQHIEAGPADFDNPHARRDFALTTGGSTGAATSVAQNLDHLAAAAEHQMLVLAAHGLLGAPGAAWLPILPGNGFYFTLQRMYLGQPIDRWFSPVGWRDSRHWVKYGLGTLYMAAWMRVLDANAPLPRVVRQQQAEVVAHWMHGVLRRHGRCVVHATVSNGVRVCLAAQAAGLDLTGAVLRVGGEPITQVKAQAIERVGAVCVPGYGTVEAGGLGLGCARPAGADDVHFISDAFALIAYPHRVEGPGVTVPAFNFTTLLDVAPKIMLNYQADDYGIVEERACGCELEACGYSTHLRQVRSYSKLTGEGVTLIGNEMLHVLEDVLPARFGGSPLDYQLQEDEDAQGLTRLYLAISPRVEIADESAVVGAVLDGLRQSSPMADAARTLWQQASTLQIRRQEPTWTGPGKLLPLNIRSGRPPGPGKAIRGNGAE